MDTKLLIRNKNFNEIFFFLGGNIESKEYCRICGQEVRNGKPVVLYNTHLGTCYPGMSIVPGVHSGPYNAKICDGCLKRLESNKLNISGPLEAYREWNTHEIKITDGTRHVTLKIQHHQ